MKIFMASQIQNFHKFYISNKTIVVTFSTIPSNEENFLSCYCLS